MDQLRELLVRLKQRGFQGHISEGPPVQIVGGRSASTTTIGTTEVPIYQNSFSVALGAKGWIIRKDGGGQLVDEAVVATPEQVVEIIAGGDRD
jgi:hypothetical protein